MYYIIGTENQYLKLADDLAKHLPKKVCNVVHERVKIFDQYYGRSRDLEKDLGGYCIVFLEEEGCNTKKQELLKKYGFTPDLYEYCLKGIENLDWTEELYVVSSDYGLIFFYPDKAKGNETC